MNDTQAMLTARRDETATALTRAIVAKKEAEAAVRDAQKLYDEACIEYGRAIPPNGFWKGDKVKRNSLRRGSYGFGMYSKKTEDKYVVERGVVTLCDGIVTDQTAACHYTEHRNRRWTVKSYWERVDA